MNDTWKCTDFKNKHLLFDIKVWGPYAPSVLSKSLKFSLWALNSQHPQPTLYRGHTGLALSLKKASGKFKSQPWRQVSADNTGFAPVHVSTGNFHSCWSIGGEIQLSQVKQKVKNKSRGKNADQEEDSRTWALSGTTALCGVPEGKDALLWGAMTFMGFQLLLLLRSDGRSRGILERKLALGRLGAEREFYC